MMPWQTGTISLQLCDQRGKSLPWCSSQKILRAGLPSGLARDVCPSLDQSSWPEARAYDLLSLGHILEKSWVGSRHPETRAKMPQPGGALIMRQAKDRSQPSVQNGRLLQDNSHA